MRRASHYLRQSLLLALVIVLLPATVASAQQVPVTFSGSVMAGETLTLTCPEGHIVEVTAEGPNASASFYRSTKRRGAVAEFVPPTSVTTNSASWIIPKGAKFADATLNCVPQVQTVTQTGLVTSTANSNVIAVCPPETPYLVSVQEVIGDADADLSTPQGQYLVPWTTTEGAVLFTIGVDDAWRATFTCSAVSQRTTITATGNQVADETQHVDCPADYPYVTSTFTFTGDADGDLSTTGDQFPLQSRFVLRLVGNDPGVPNYTGFEFRLEPGMAWSATVVCSTVPAST